ARVNEQVAADPPSSFLQSLQESRQPGLVIGIVRGQGHQYADTPHPARLLRARRERPRRCRAAEQPDEVAPSQLIEEHSVPYQPGSLSRISNGHQSAGIGALAEPLPAPLGASLVK